MPDSNDTAAAIPRFAADRTLLRLTRAFIEIDNHEAFILNLWGQTDMTGSRADDGTPPSRGLS